MWACMGIVGRRGSIARDVKKRCACLVRAHAFSQPRGNGRAGVWVVGGALVVVRCEDARAAAAREQQQQQLDYCARGRGGRMIACLPACSSSSSSSSSSFSPARRASVGDLIVGI